MGGHPLHPTPLIRLPAKATKPEHTHALIVGIERYAAGPLWDLNGPLNDALAIRRWLLGSGVPAGQIHLHVSALEANQAELNNLKIDHHEATDQALRKTIESLKKIPVAQDDLLVLYWAGHGLISTEHHCLLLAEATYQDCKTYSVGNLRSSFANENCPGFAQQIFLFDTCRSFHRQPESPPPVVPLPLGQQISKSQFIFFASQEGQAATNLGQEQCGLFTKMLLEKIASSKEAKDVWPPKMDNIATSVQQMFAENPQQYPVYKYYRGWQGNESIDSLPADGAPAPAKAADPIDRLDAVNGLALMLAKHLARPTQRDDVLNAFEYCPPLGPSISGRVERRSDALGDCKQIISTCLKFSGGIELLERVTLGNLGQIRDHDAIVLSFKSLSSLRDEAVTNV
jgi:hypothetical protein